MRNTLPGKYCNATAEEFSPRKQDLVQLISLEDLLLKVI